jgi:hypothetical protein
LTEIYATLAGMEFGVALARIRPIGVIAAALALAASMAGQSAKTPPPFLAVAFDPVGLSLAEAWQAAAAPSPLRIDPGAAEVTRMDAFVIHAPPPQQDVVRPTENPVDRFFRTGILESAEFRRSTLKVTVGPCEGGQLLNLKSVW